MNNGNVRRRTGAGDFGEKPLRRYELQATLTAGGSASAKFVAWDGSAYSDTTDSFTLYSCCSASGIAGDRGFCYYTADRQQWEVLEGIGGTSGIAILSTDLNYGASATAVLYVGTPLSETAGASITVYPWKMLPGDSIPAGTEIDVAIVNGYWYLRNAACSPPYGS